MAKMPIAYILEILLTVTIACGVFVLLASLQFDAFWKMILGFSFILTLVLGGLYLSSTSETGSREAPELSKPAREADAQLAGGSSAGSSGDQGRSE